MSESWSHPQLGAFTYDSGCWRGHIECPALGMYPSGDGNGKQTYGHTSFECSITVADHGPPSTDQVDILLQLLENAEDIAPAILDAVWLDICGEGPGSKYWWNGDLDQLNEIHGLTSETPIATKDGLLQSLPVSEIGIGYQHKTAIEVSFYPEWEIEHNVGALIKDKKVIGIGYQLDVEPFESEAEGWPPYYGPPVRNPFTGEMIPRKFGDPPND